MQRPNGFRVLVLTVVAAALTALPSPQAHAAPAAAPAFTLELLNGSGKILSLADYKGSPVILLFWAPW